MRTSRHEIRIGMSCYWCTLRPEANGYTFDLGPRGVGWAAGNRREALAEAREMLVAYEKRANDKLNGGRP